LIRCHFPGILTLAFTSSTSVGQKITENGSKTIKKLALELGGKSPLIILDDYDMKKAAQIAVSKVLLNSGQMCSAPTRTLIFKAKHDEFINGVKEVLHEFPVGHPEDEKRFLGRPIISEKQYHKVQGYIEKGISEMDRRPSQLH
jgi:aldehyde dehydrogenase (NAD+)